MYLVYYRRFNLLPISVSIHVWCPHSQIITLTPEAVLETWLITEPCFSQVIITEYIRVITGGIKVEGLIKGFIRSETRTRDQQGRAINRRKFQEYTARISTWKAQPHQQSV